MGSLQWNVCKEDDMNREIEISRLYTMKMNPL